MWPQQRTPGPYGWLPALIGVVALAGLVICSLGLSSLRTHLIAGAGRTLALTAAESVDKLDLILLAHVRGLRTLGDDAGPEIDDAAALATRLQAFAADHPEFRWIGVTDLSAQLIASTDPSR